MRNVFCVWRIARLQLLKGLSQAKIWVVLLFVPLVLQPALAPVLSMSADVGESITIMGVVFIFSDIYNSALSVLFNVGAVLLFSDAPFFDAQQQQCMLRVDSRTWITAQMLYMLCLSILYTLYWIVCTGLILAPRISLSLEWGPVWKTLAFTNAASQYHVTLDCPISLIRQYSPLQSFLLSLTLKTTLCLLFGCIAMFLNLWTKSRCGIYACLALVMQDYMTMNGLGMPYIWFAPASMSRLSMLDAIGTNIQPMPWQALGILLSVIAVCTLFIYFTRHHIMPE